MESQFQMWEKLPVLVYSACTHTHTHTCREKHNNNTHLFQLWAQAGHGASFARTGEPSRCPVAFLALCLLHSVPVAWQDSCHGSR